MPTLFKLITLDDDTYYKIIERIGKEKQFLDAHTSTGYHPNVRKCKTFFIKGPVLNDIIFPIIQKVNLDEKWNFKLVEPNGYSYNRYEEGDFYTWHTDGKLSDKKTYLRKVSFSLGLSNDYSEGDFLIQAKRSKEGEKLYYQKFHLKEKQMIIFKSDVQHMVNKVTEGQRDSLVGWIYGPRDWNL
jgi:predicted 2-oxoglutarate/Fe(II)-dependent dioxygenase YbiX